MKLSLPWGRLVPLVFLVLTVATPAGSSERTSAEVAAARCPLPEQPRSPGAEGPNIVLIAIDTLRADHLGFLGDEPSVSPNLDALATDSVVFERAFATAPWTTPSFASLWTGRHPAELGFEREPIRLPDQVPTLGEELASRGYTTVGIVSHLFLGEKFGFHRGFDFWNEEAAGGHEKISSPEVTDLAAQCLAALAPHPSPFFLFVHYFDPHYDYLAHPEFPLHGEFEARIRSRGDNFEVLRRMARAGELNGDDLRYLRALYDSEIAFTDAAIGRLLGTLRTHGLYDDAMIVLLADHGEMFGERSGRWIGHTRFLYDSLVRVPLVIKRPGGDVGGGRIRRAVSLADILPTILGEVDRGGPSPRSLLADGDRPERPVFSQTRRWHELDAVVFEGWKLILDRKRREIELYDLTTDPAELENRAAAHLERRDQLLDLLATWTAHNERERARLEGVEVPELSEDELEKLRSLGYIQ